MDRAGITDFVEKNLPIHEEYVTDANDRMVWVSEVIDLFHKVSNTTPEDDFVEGGRYLCELVQESETAKVWGIREIKCHKVTENAYYLEDIQKEKFFWIKKEWSKIILEKLG